MAHSPAFLIYSASMIVLCLNILALWAYSGSVRGKVKVSPNPEDTRTGDTRLGDDPPEIARVLRAHRNAADNIVPFAILGLLFVLWGGSTLLTAIFCGIFTMARLGHTFAYLGEKQPWRTIAFVVGGLDTLAMVGFLAKALLTSA